MGLAQWLLRLFAFDIYFIPRARVKQQPADVLSKIATNGEKAITLTDDLPVCKGEKTQLMREEILLMHAWTYFEVANGPFTDQDENDSTKMGETSLSTVQRTASRETIGQVLSLDDLASKQFRVTYIREPAS